MLFDTFNAEKYVLSILLWQKTLRKCCLQTCFGILTLKKEDYYKVFSQCGDVMTSAFNY